MAGSELATDLLSKLCFLSFLAFRVVAGGIDSWDGRCGTCGLLPCLAPPAGPGHHSPVPQAWAPPSAEGALGLVPELLAGTNSQLPHYRRGMPSLWMGTQLPGGLPNEGTASWGLCSGGGAGEGHVAALRWSQTSLPTEDIRKGGSGRKTLRA